MPRRLTAHIDLGQRVVSPARLTRTLALSQQDSHQQPKTETNGNDRTSVPEKFGGREPRGGIIDKRSVIIMSRLPDVMRDIEVFHAILLMAPTRTSKRAGVQKYRSVALKFHSVRRVDA
jgi:hypothetical protein